MSSAKIALVGLLLILILTLAVGPVAACSGSVSNVELTDDDTGIIAPQCRLDMRKEGVPAGGGTDLGLAITALSLMSITALLIRLQ